MLLKCQFIYHRKHICWTFLCYMGCQYCVISSTCVLLYNITFVFWKNYNRINSKRQLSDSLLHRNRQSYTIVIFQNFFHVHYFIAKNYLQLVILWHYPEYFSELATLCTGALMPTSHLKLVSAWKIKSLTYLYKLLQ